jgi:hypothetical protein
MYHLLQLIKALHFAITVCFVLPQHARAGIAQPGSTARVRFLVVTKDFSPLQSVRTGPEARPASYTMGTGSYFPQTKADGA